MALIARILISCIYRFIFVFLQENHMDKNSHISLVLSSFRQYLSLTQAQFANDINTKLGYNKSDKEFLTQSSVNRIEKGNAISDKRTYDFLLNKFFFSNLDKCSNCAQLAKFIVEELYISDVNIDALFDCNKKLDLLLYLFKPYSESDSKSLFQMEEYSSKINFVNKQMEKYPSKVYIENPTYPNIQLSVFDGELNSLSLLLIYIAFFYLYSDKVNNIECKYCINDNVVSALKSDKIIKDELNNLFEDIDNFDSLSKSLKTRLVNSINKKIVFTFRLFRSKLFKDYYRFSLKYNNSDKDLFPYDNIVFLEKLSNLSSDNQDAFEAFDTNELLKLQSILSFVFNDPLPILANMLLFVNEKKREEEEKKENKNL